MDHVPFTRRLGLSALLVVLVTAGFVAPAAAHGWGNTTTTDGYTLSLHTDPANPVADVETNVLGRIQNTSVGRTHRTPETSNETVIVAITGPNGSRDRLTATMPENDTHFAVSYRFPTAGTYDIVVKTTIGGEPVAFRTSRSVAATTTTEQISKTGTGSTSDTRSTGSGETAGTVQTAETTRTADTQRVDTGTEHDSILWKLTTIQFLSGAAVVLAGSALWAAVMAYRGTD